MCCRVRSAVGYHWKFLPTRNFPPELLARNLTSEQHLRDPDHKAQGPHPSQGDHAMLPWKRVLRPLAALILAAAAVTVPTATSAQAAEAAPSRGWNDYRCKPSAAHPRPVVLVHGTFGNSVDNWLGLAPYLKHRGYCVFS